jgi:hypothetical protein
MADQKYTPPPGFPPGLAKVCSQLGDLRLAEGSKVAEVILKHAPDTQRGVRVITGARTGHEKKYGTEEEKRTRWNAYQVEVDRRHELDPSLLYGELCDKAAEHFGVCKKTIERYTVNTVNPRKKKSGQSSHCPKPAR